MSNPTATSAMAFPPDDMPAAVAPTPADLPQEPPRSFTRQALIDTFRRTGARVGLAWVAVLVVCGVFAPFLANSHPLLLKTGGRWSSPLLRHLTPADVVLLVMTLVCIVAYFLRDVRPAVKLFMVVGCLLISILLAKMFVRPPETVTYEHYRSLQRDGKVEAIVRAPVPYSPTDYMRDAPELRRKPPSARHWFGTEDYGADILSRMIHASRIALTIGLIATGIAVVLGIVIGGLMGYFVGVVDMFGMRLIEIFEAVPVLFLMITFVAVFGRNLYIMMALIGFLSWTGNARFIRAEFLKLRKQDFVQAAIAAGLPLRSVIFRHMLPNGIAPVLVSASFGIAAAILTESVISFLGLGLVQEPSWGGMLNQARAAGGNFSWWIAVFPGMAIFLTVFAYNLIGEAMRDALDPKLRGIK